MYNVLVFDGKIGFAKRANLFKAMVVTLVGIKIHWIFKAPCAWFRLVG